MTAIFPGAIVSNTNIPDTNPLTSLGANNHSLKHNDMRDEIVAIETKVGANGSAVTTSIDYLLKNIASTDPGHKHTPSAITGLLAINNVSTSVAPSGTSGTFIYNLNATGGALNFTLPSGVSNTAVYNVTKIDSSANAVTLVGIVNGITNPTLNYQNDSVTLVSDTDHWRII